MRLAMHGEIRTQTRSGQSGRPHWHGSSDQVTWCSQTRSGRTVVPGQDKQREHCWTQRHVNQPPVYEMCHVSTSTSLRAIPDHKHLSTTYVTAQPPVYDRCHVPTTTSLRVMPPHNYKSTRDATLQLPSDLFCFTLVALWHNPLYLLLSYRT